jgi:hypothetical protein
MATHQVHFSIPSRELGKADIEFKVWQDDKLLGTLAVSKGAVVWFPSGTTYGHKMTWSKFDALMKERGTGVESR